MKKIKTFYKALLILIVISSCKDETNLEFLNDVALPSNIGVNFIVTQDNTGLATITHLLKEQLLLVLILEMDQNL